jgi:hypothetical protein
MSTATPDVRTHVMTVVEVSWQDAGRAGQTVSARMEDKSAGGACLRLKQSVEVGAKLKIQWRHDQFIGIVKYCRAEGRDFVVGVQRDKNFPTEGAPAQTKKENTAPLPKSPEHEARVETPAIQTEQPAPTNSALVPRPRRERNIREWRRFSRQHAIPTVRMSANTGEIFQHEAGNERKPMKRKWLDLAPWHSKEKDRNHGGNVEENGDRNPISPSADSQRNESRGIPDTCVLAGKDQPMTTTQLEKPPANSAREVPTFQVELLPVEEVFRVAGVVSPRKGYSVQKVIEMINSEHIRNLAKEMKRAAILMALDAAGVSVDQIQRDAKARQDALDSYETSQKKQADTEWTRKAEEIAQIQSELESIKAHYAARIDRCSEALARDKARFRAWATTKEQESLAMTEAVDLCLKAPISESAATALANAASVGAGSSPTTKALA